MKRFRMSSSERETQLFLLAKEVEGTLQKVLKTIPEEQKSVFTVALMYWLVHFYIPNGPMKERFAMTILRENNPKVEPPSYLG